MKYIKLLNAMKKEAYCVRCEVTAGSETVHCNSNVRTRQRVLDPGNMMAVHSPSPQMCFRDLPVGLFLLKNKTGVSTSA